MARGGESGSVAEVGGQEYKQLPRRCSLSGTGNKTEQEVGGWEFIIKVQFNIKRPRDDISFASASKQLGLMSLD